MVELSVLQVQLSEKEGTIMSMRENPEESLTPLCLLEYAINESIQTPTEKQFHNRFIEELKTKRKLDAELYEIRKLKKIDFNDRCKTDKLVSMIEKSEKRLDELVNSTELSQIIEREKQRKIAIREEWYENFQKKQKEEKIKETERFFEEYEVRRKKAEKQFFEENLHKKIFTDSDLYNKILKSLSLDNEPQPIDYLVIVTVYCINQHEKNFKDGFLLQTKS